MRESWRHLTHRRTGLLVLALAVATSVLLSSHASLAVPDDDFSLEVSPAVLAATVKPNTKTTLELKIRNAGKKTETLKFETRSFTQDSRTGEIKVSTSTPPDLGSWIHYENPTFTVKPGEWFTEKINVNLPGDAAFSYPFAVVISRADEKAVQDNGRLIKGSVAVFALVNVDKPGATRAVEIKSLKPSQSVYEFLPANIELELYNRGNSIVQPYGNVYIQSSGSNEEPLSVLPLNSSRGYILPNTTRKFNFAWQDGFPYYKTITKDGKETKELTWDWDTVSHLRFGHFSAKVVAVYNDGVRDIPVIGEVSFWVIPWRIIAVGLVLFALIAFGIWSIVRGVFSTSKRIVNHGKKSSD